MKLETERLFLRPWEDSDAEELYKYASDPRVGLPAGWPPHTSVENSLGVIHSVFSQPETYAVVLKETGKAVGSAGIMTNEYSNLPLEDNEAEIGYWIGVPYWGQGLIPEAVRELLRRCFEELGCTAVMCSYFDGNDKSKRVQEKCGFVHSHTDENYYSKLLGEHKTLHINRLTYADWQKNRQPSSLGYHLLDRDRYYRKGVYRHFTEDCKCSTSITARVDVTELYAVSKQTGSKFYINFLWLLSKTLNSRPDYRLFYRWQTDDILVYDKINPIQYIFYDDTETCTPVYTEYCEDYNTFYAACVADIEQAKQTREYGLDYNGHPNWFDASYISWLSYDSLNVELPDGYLHFMPIVNWGRFREENGRKLMPLTVRLNHAVADGYLVAKVFAILNDEIKRFTGK